MTVNPWKPRELGEFISIEEHETARKFWAETLLNLIADIDGGIDIVPNLHLDPINEPKGETPEEFLRKTWFTTAKNRTPSADEQNVIDRCNKENKLIIINIHHNKRFTGPYTTAFGTSLREAAERALAGYYSYVEKSKKQEES